ncbi:MAG: tRNA 2-thiouridine(34) synthase MnmA [Verrucomicrobiae bacterium]|nr:tRNA 2-thiouridine(34) synthase MnmA [Verrucomicrobiae bacterium]
MPITEKKRVLAAISGGVDSSVAAALLLEQGHEVVGAYMKNWTNEEELPGDCPWEQDIRDARAVCDHLGIEFRILSLMDQYRDRVVDYLLSGYREGVTPNPDVMCNREMKFGIFLDFALDQGFDAIATGHYARLAERDDGSVDILRGRDPNKDQTYFLALLEQPQIVPAMFPIGDLPKSEVRDLAKRFELPVASKKDSQGICFIGNIKMSDFLSYYIPDRPGAIVTLDGREVGEHRGLHLYTLGQRKGLGVASNTFGKAYVVVEKRPATNELVVAFDEPDTPRLYASRCRIGGISMTNRPLSAISKLSIQPRYRCRATPVSVELSGEGGAAEVRFETPQRALTPGQIAAFYEGETLVGGGVFQEIYHPSEATVAVTR